MPPEEDNQTDIGSVDQPTSQSENEINFSSPTPDPAPEPVAEPTPIETPIEQPAPPESISAEPAPEPTSTPTQPTVPEPQSPVEVASPQPISTPAHAEPVADASGVTFGQVGAQGQKSSGKSVLKIVLIVVGSIVGVFAVIFIVLAVFVLQSTPEYTNLSTQSVQGYSNANSGMTFLVPDEFELGSSTQEGVAYYDYISNEDKSDDKIYAEIIASIGSLPAKPTKEEIVDALKELEATANDPEQIATIADSGVFTDTKLSSFSKDEEAGSARIDVTGTLKIDGEDSPGKVSVVFIFSETGYIYTFGVSASDLIWEKNSKVFEEVITSVKVDQYVSPGEETQQ